MAEFELRIYVIPEESIDEITEQKNLHDITDLTNKEVVEIAEEIGTVYSLYSFLRLPVISPEKDYVRAFYISRDNSDIIVPADNPATLINADRITSHMNEYTHYVLLDNRKEV